MMMIVEKKIGLATSAMRRMVRRASSGLSGASSRSFSSVSVITIAPSTRMPKSMAPSDSRLAGMPVRCIRMKATSSEIGMVAATIRALSGLPRKISRIPITRSMPKKSVCSTVLSVVPTSSVRSMNGRILTPFGRTSLLSSSTAAWTCSSTLEGFW